MARTLTVVHPSGTFGSGTSPSVSPDAGSSRSVRVHVTANMAEPYPGLSSGSVRRPAPRRVNPRPRTSLPESRAPLISSAWIAFLHISAAYRRLLEKTAITPESPHITDADTPATKEIRRAGLGRRPGSPDFRQVTVSPQP
ncbi:hypothetical protein Sme01_72650 [Sphaerisporangium melleum]|uniref:Uncharacterized protein n=1 Tax=Sphaerisporangium melleum TaxID=321316 RepID=A0A917RPM7_9ACTN|nr:hypothetical protein GCM10007964_70630 [Sphaerisporangium melleum]GII74789.1 hypothetical protein Sme01_72650 [Sphaerisporangium melleum]